MEPKKVYYSVFGLKDGTVYLARPVPKPHKSKGGREPKIDPEGI